MAQKSCVFLENYHNSGTSPGLLKNPTEKVSDRHEIQGLAKKIDQVKNARAR